jgi:hypothetical protein
VLISGAVGIAPWKTLTMSYRIGLPDRVHVQRHALAAHRHEVGVSDWRGDDGRIERPLAVHDRRDLYRLGDGARIIQVQPHWAPWSGIERDGPVAVQVHDLVDKRVGLAGTGPIDDPGRDVVCRRW